MTKKEKANNIFHSCSTEELKEVVASAKEILVEKAEADIKILQEKCAVLVELKNEAEK